MSAIQYAISPSCYPVSDQLRFSDQSQVRHKGTEGNVPFVSNQSLLHAWSSTFVHLVDANTFNWSISIIFNLHFQFRYNFQNLIIELKQEGYIGITL